MGMNQFLQVLNQLPEIVEQLKNMGEEEKREFVNKLGLQDEEKDHAFKIFNSFQAGEALNKEEKIAAQGLLLKVIEMNDMKMSDILGKI
ncbi:MAG: hypothetical protein PHI90_01440 [Clostridia bacterium]|nr:hypothetical protein [Clostridia bacterium]MDD4047489.1 hypothetical protein [Clostridia bacterium]